jgi:hypothetical protein
MRKAPLLLCTLFLLFFINRLNAQCGNGRYYNKIFSTSTTTVQYGHGPEYDGHDTVLMVDVYQPTGDNFAHRPLMIFAFGGSFTSGVRQSPDLITLCTYFAQRGYVCASIDYRLGMYNSSDTNEFRALIRGVQDMKAAVRYFYKDAQTANQFRIDTSQIFIGGVSAGAFIALNYAYMKLDTFSKTPPGFAPQVIIDLGGPDGNSGNPGYSQKVKGVIDLSGAIADTVWIMPGDPILVGEHGTEDSTVACYYDSLYALVNVKSSLYGGGDIKNRLSHIHMDDSLYLFYGAGHVPFILPKDQSLSAILAVPNYMDTTERLIRDFLYPHIVCDSTLATDIDEIADNIFVSVYPNPADDAANVVASGASDLYLGVYTIDGRLAEKELLPANSDITLYKSRLGAGLYLLQFTDKATGRVLKTDKLIFY